MPNIIEKKPNLIRHDSQLEHLKIPPHSLEAEQAVLGGLMLDSKAWDNVVDRLTLDDFYRPEHRLIFNAMTELAQRNIPFDVLTLSDSLKNIKQLENVGGEVYLFELANNTPSAANIVAYADIVRERSVLRQLISIATEVANSAFNPEGRVSNDLLDEAERKIFKIAEHTARGSGPVKVSSLLAAAADRIDTLYHSTETITGVPTGFNDIDELTSGLQAGDLVIVAGRPSMGKTAFAMNMAEHAAIKAKKPVLVFSMEMPGESLAIRMLSSIGRVDQHRVRTGKLSDEDWARITSTIAILSEAPMYIDDTPALSPTEVRARARRVAREQKLGLIVIDYLQLMQVPGTKESRALEISEISRSLKALAKELNVPVLALSQLNRGLEQRTDKRPVMSDLRECVPGNTLVMLSDGRRVPIAELQGQTPEVMAVTEQGHIVNAQCERIWAVGRKPIFTVYLASGRTLQATDKHKILTSQSWLELNKLKTGDRIALARKLPEPKQTEIISDLKLALLGQMIGDGSYLSGQPMRYTTSSEENSQLVYEAVTKEFNCEVKRYRGRRTWHQLLISGNGTRWCAAGVNKWFRELGIFGQRSFEKRIPELVFRLANRQIAIVLRHLWATDGTIYVSKNHSKQKFIIGYSTNSAALATDIMALLLRFGIVARKQTVQKARYRPTHLLSITGVDMQQLFLDQIGAFGPRCEQAKILQEKLRHVVANTNVDTLPQELFARVKLQMQEYGISQRQMASMRGTAYGGTSHFKFSPSRKTLKEYAEILNDDVLRAHCDNDLFWDRIVAIEPAGEAEVYDLTVPGPASWLADGIVSHNSGAIEQDADLIAFIYRDEVYNPETAAKGTAEILIAKHRNGPIGKVTLTFLGQFTRFENFANSTISGFDE